jgi:transcriptional regulator with XRE-family HTH domain
LTVTASPPYASLATVLKRRRLRLGLSQLKLGLEIEMDSSEISRIESGWRNPHWSTLRRMAKALGAPLSEIVGEVERLEAEKSSP